MDASEHSHVLRLRRQSRWLVMATVLFFLLGMVVAMPSAIGRRKALLAANSELLALQAAIVYTQGQIQAVQLQIVGAQRKIGAAIDGH